MFFWNSSLVTLSHKGRHDEAAPGGGVSTAARVTSARQHLEEARESMKMRRILTAVASGAIIMASSASMSWAQTANQPVAERETHDGFESDEITGELVKPFEERVMPDVTDKERSVLIRVRADFVPDIMKSVGEI